MATTTEELTAKIQVSVDSKGAVQGINILSNSLKNFEGNVNVTNKISSDLSERFKGLGSAIVVANQAVEIANKIYRGLKGTFDATVGSAISLGKSVAEITTLLDNNANHTEKLKDEILGLQARYGGDQADIARAYYNAISSGAVDASNAIELLDNAQKLAIGGVTSLDNATKGMVSIMNTYGISAGNAARISDALFIGMKKGQTTVGELSLNIGMVADIAKTVGLSMEEMVSSVAAMTTAGITTSTAVTQLSAIMAGLAEPSEDLARIFKQLNIENIQLQISSKGFYNVLKDIVSQTDGTASALFRLFGRKEAVLGLLKMTSDTIGPRYIATLNEMSKAAENQGAVTKEAYDKLSKTASQQWDIIKGSALSALTRIGDAILTGLMPALISLAESFETIVESSKDLAIFLRNIDFNGVAEKVRNMVIAFVALKTVMIAISFAKAAEGVTLLSVAFGILTPKIIASTIAMRSFAVSLLKFAAWIAAIYAISIAVEFLVKNFEKLDIVGKVVLKRFEVSLIGLKLAWKKFTAEFKDGLFEMQEVSSGFIERWTGFSLNMDKVRETQTKYRNEISATTQEYNKQREELKLLSKQLDLTAFGVPFKEAKTDVKDSAEWTTKMLGEYDKLLSKLKQGEISQRKITELTKEQSDYLDQLTESNRRLDLEIRNFQVDQEQVILNNLAFDKESIILKERKLGLEKGITGELGRQMSRNRELIEKRAKMEIEAIQKKKEEEEKKKMTPEMEVAGAIGAIIGEGVGSAVEAFEDSWNTLADITDEFVAKWKIGIRLGFDFVRKLEKTVGTEGILRAQPTDIIPGIELDTSKIAGEMTKGFAGTVGALQGSVGMYIAAAQAVVDILPNTMNNLTKLFDSIAQWPTEMLKATENMMNSALKVVTDFIPKLFNTIPQIFKKIFVEGIPKIIVALTEVYSNIDDIVINGFIERMPELVEEATKRFVSAMPILVDRLVVFLVRKMPYIALKLAESAAIEIPVALTQGLIDAMKMAWDYVIKGKKPDWFNKEQAEQSARKFAAIVTLGTSENMFAVLNEESRKKAQRDADQIAQAFDKGSKKARTTLEKWWHELEKAWHQFWNAIKDDLQKVWDKIVEAWRAVWKLISDIWEGIKTAIMSILNQLMDWIGHWISEAGKILSEFITWFLEGVGKFLDGVVQFGSAIVEFLKNIVKSLAEGAESLIKGLVEAFKQVVGLIGTAIMSSFEKAGEIFTTAFSKVRETFTWIKEKVFDPFTNAIDSILTGIGKAFSSITNFFANIGTNILDGLKTALGSIGNLFSNLGNDIWNGLKAGLDTLGDFFKNLFDKLNPANLFEKIFKVDMKGKGIVEKTLGIDIPFISFAQGGMVPGNPVTNGDSKLNDRILALLSPGEAIIPRSVMDDPILSKVIQAILSGKIDVPNFALGGTLGKVASGDIKGAWDDIRNISTEQAKKELQGLMDMTTSILDMLNPAKMWDQVKKFVFNDMIWKMLEANKFHDGGVIRNRFPSYAFGTDEIPIRAQSGEFMLNRTGRGLIGDSVLNAANRGVNTNNSTQNISITINTSKPFDESLLKSRIIPEIKKEIKRNSLDGRFLLDQRGLRA